MNQKSSKTSRQTKTKTIVSNYGGLEIIQNISSPLFLVRVYKVWTKRFSVFEHTPNDIIETNHWTYAQTHQTASSKPYETLLENSKTNMLHDFKASII